VEAATGVKRQVQSDAQHIALTAGAQLCSDLFYWPDKLRKGFALANT
jgi:hypothetical protein